VWWIFLLVISILPVYYLGNKIYKNDYEKEPKKLLIKLFIFGILSVLVTLGLTELLTAIFPFFDVDASDGLNIISLMIYVFIGIALIEEFAKWLFAYFGTYNDVEFNHAYDAIVYCVFVSLGFACIENCLYVLMSDSSIQTAIMRAISAVPGHASFGIFMGYFIALAKTAEKNNNQKIANKNKMLSLVVPIVLHGIYDYLLFATVFSSLFLIVFIFFVVWLFKNATAKVNQLSKVTKNLNGQSIAQENNHQISRGYNFCPICGDRVRGNFCRVCGHYHKFVNNEVNQQNN
jgi:Predicted membrane protein